MNKIIAKCPAKINLFLNIIGLRDDNYHLMRMINQTVDLYDYITIERINEKGIRLTSNSVDIPTNETNSVYKAAWLFLKATKNDEVGLKIDIQKNIPVESGLGGESTDAAGTLLALNKLFAVDLSMEALIKLGIKVGCDVPYLLTGGTCRVYGVGEIVEKTENLSQHYFLIVKPDFDLKTEEMFLKYDSLVHDFEVVEMDKLMYNDFEKIAPIEIEKIKEKMLANGALLSAMTGSGPAVVGLFENHLLLEAAYIKLKKKYKRIYKCESVDGIKLLVDENNEENAE